MSVKESEQSKTYYHVVPEHYAGGDILCRDHLEQKGIGYKHKWEMEPEEYPHGDIVCLFEAVQDAEDYRDEFERGGRILSIEFPDYALQETITLLTNEEGYLCVLGSIPAEFVQGEGDDS